MYSYKSVIVTGAASGIGRECARFLLAQGNRVLAVSRSRDRLVEALGAETGDLKLLAADVADLATGPAAAAAAIEAFGRIDGVINMAALHSKLDWKETTGEEFNRILMANVTGSYVVSKAAVETMIERGIEGAVVMCGSGSILSGSPGGRGRGGPAYTASKGGITVLVRSLANAWGEYGIRVNAVSPGVTESAMTADYSDDARAAAANGAVLGRMGLPGEPAKCAVWLLSDEASFVTGEAVYVNGGLDFGATRVPPGPGSRRQGFRASVAWAKFTLSKLRDARLGDSRS
jgi:3-oxoacyl-[acyl-carrier protein] reductase